MDMFPDYAARGEAFADRAPPPAAQGDRRPDRDGGE